METNNRFSHWMNDKMVEQHNTVYDLSQRVKAHYEGQQNNEEMVVMTKAEEMKKMVVDSLVFLGSSHEEAIQIASQLKDGKDFFGAKTGLANA